MKSKYSFENREKYLYMKVTGQYDYNDSINYLSLILEECKKLRKNRIIVDMFDVEDGDIPIIDRFNLGEKMAEIIKRQVKIAIVFPERYINKMLETVAWNRGVNIGVFPDLQHAKHWLL